MKKSELIDAIRNAGAEVKSSMSKEELQQIYDGLHVHENKPEKETEEPEKEVEEPEKETEEPEKETEKPEKETEEPEKETEEPEKDEMSELFEKVSGASAPPPKSETKKPIIEKKQRKNKKGESSPDSTIIEGYVLLLVVDVVFPFAFSFLNNIIDKKVKIKAEDIQLTETEWKKIEPLADQAAAYMSININPVAGFLIVSAFMYSNNLMLARQTVSGKSF